MKKIKKERNFTSYLYILPAFLAVALVQWIPALMTIYRSFFQWDFVKDPKWIGLSNYVRLFQERQILTSIINTLYYIIGTCIFGVGLALILALVIHYLIKSRIIKMIGKIAFFIPIVFSPTAIGIIWKLIFSSKPGALNEILRIIGLENFIKAWLISAPPFGVWLRVGAFVWWIMGFNVIMFLAGLENLPSSQLEAAKIDGATFRQSIIHILIPLLNPIIAIVLTNSLIVSVRVFDIPWIMRMGTGRVTETLTVTMYKDTFLLTQVGWGSSIATITTLLAIILIARWLKDASVVQ